MIEALLALLFGLLIGSFLNVCIYRWPRDLSVVRPRSHCPSCEKPIAWSDNIPLASYLRLRGRCRACGFRIPWRYPAVELATGLLFFVYVLALGPSLAALRECCFAGMLIGLLFADLEERILPDEFTIGGTVVGLLFAIWVPVPDFTAQAVLWLMGLDVSGRVQSIAESAMGATLPALVLWGGGWIYQRIRHKEGLGFGDVKLMMMVGSFVGLRGALSTLVMGSLAGSLIGYAYIYIAKKDSSTYELPFGTFLGLAALLVSLTGEKMMAWYGGLR
jgi:leader peptidase (prepilin peptidase) / N-methyltransferase